MFCIELKSPFRLTPQVHGKLIRNTLSIPLVQYEEEKDKINGFTIKCVKGMFGFGSRAFNTVGYVQIVNVNAMSVSYKLKMKIIFDVLGDFIFHMSNKKPCAMFMYKSSSVRVTKDTQPNHIILDRREEKKGRRTHTCRRIQTKYVIKQFS